jgi:hypothetical protein
VYLYCTPLHFIIIIWHYNTLWFIILLSATNKTQGFTLFFIIVNALHVSGGFSAHHQELKNCTHSIWYVPGLLVATASVVELA